MSEVLDLLVFVFAGVLSITVVFTKDPEKRDALFRGALLIFLALIYRALHQ